MNSCVAALIVLLFPGVSHASGKLGGIDYRQCNGTYCVRIEGQRGSIGRIDGSLSIREATVVISSDNPEDSLSLSSDDIFIDGPGTTILIREGGAASKKADYSISIPQKKLTRWN